MITKFINSVNITKDILITKRKVLQSAKIPGEVIHSEKESEIIWDLAYKYIRPRGFALEVGSWKGHSSYIIASVCKIRNAQLVCIDSFNGDMLFGGDRNSNDFFRENILSHLEGLPVSYLMMDSREAHKILGDRMFDFAYIDGDHSEPVVGEDIKNYFKKVRTGGVYCGHDYGFVFADPKVVYRVKENVDKICGKVQVKETIWIKKVNK